MSGAASSALPSAVAPLSRPGRGASRRVLPGFKLTLGFTLFYLSIIVLIPLSALVFKTFTLTWEQFVFAVSSPRVMAAYRLTFGASFIAAVVNAVFGLLSTNKESYVLVVLGLHQLLDFGLCDSEGVGNDFGVQPQRVTLRDRKVNLFNLATENHS